jgi:SAM-dependent methyltransferase
MLAVVKPQREADSDGIVCSGRFSGAAIPALWGYYADKVFALLALAGARLSSEEQSQFRAEFKRKLHEGYASTPYARFLVAYAVPEPPAAKVEISMVPFSLADEIKNWVDGIGGEQPYGLRPDAKVMDVAQSLPVTAAVLDVGAGTGRNALPLARLGYAVDALEPTPVLAQSLVNDAARENLALRVIERDLFDESTELEQERYELIMLSEVLTHFTLDEIEQAFAKMTPALVQGGILLCNAFIWMIEGVPDEVARQASKTLWSTFITPQELEARTRGLGLTLLSEESAAAYEQAHLPADAWPPNPWFENWARGRNVFDARFGPAPIELRWLVFRRSER